jgi:hypothetical protein
MGAFVGCRACTALAEGDAFGAAICDLFDNRTQDGSCGAIQPAHRCGPGSHWIDGPCAPGLDVLVGTGAVLGIDLDADCVTDLSLALSGDAVLERSAPIDRSLNFPGPTDCNGAPCGSVDGHLDVIDTEIVSLSLTGPGVALAAGGDASVPLSPSIGTVVERGDPALGDSFLDVFLELELNGARLYNHVPLKLQAAVDSDPPEATYLPLVGCMPLFDDPLGGAPSGGLVTVELTTRRCGGGVPGVAADTDLDGFAVCIDCDDRDPAIFPGALELCDFVDNDCDRAVDEPFDLDLDGFTTCGGDCDDTLASRFPGNTEVCDLLDNDCNGLVDDDQDGDGFTPCSGDCDESNPDANPFVTELCGDGIDNNCNGLVDEFCP